MWQYFYGDDDMCLIYYLDEIPIIEINRNFFNLIESKKFIAHIVPKNEEDRSYYSQVTHNKLLDNEVSDDDLDVLKFKSLLKAKEMGWDVNINSK